MKATARRTWQMFEQRVAEWLGCRRQVCSGSSGRDDLTQSDSTHPRLFVECKLAARHAVRTLYDETRAKARKEGKTPLLCLADKHRVGWLVVFHVDEQDAVIDELMRAAASAPIGKVLVNEEIRDTSAGA